MGLPPPLVGQNTTVPLHVGSVSPVDRGTGFYHHHPPPDYIESSFTPVSGYQFPLRLPSFRPDLRLLTSNRIHPQSQPDLPGPPHRTPFEATTPTLVYDEEPRSKNVEVHSNRRTNPNRTRLEPPSVEEEKRSVLSADELDEAGDARTCVCVCGCVVVVNAGETQHTSHRRPGHTGSQE